jgi:hypothetical protein
MGRRRVRVTAGKGKHMTDTDTDIEPGTIRLVDTEGKPLDIKQVRGKMAGDIFIGHDISDLPAQGAKFVATIAGEVKGKYDIGPTKGGDWILTATLLVNERRSFELLERDAEPNLFEDKWTQIIDDLDDHGTEVDRSYIEAAAQEARDAGWSIVGFARVIRAAAATGGNPLDAVRLQVQLDAPDVVAVPDAEEARAE